MKFMGAAFIASLVLIAPTYASSSAPETLGKWCDRVGNIRMYIVILKRSEADQFAERIFTDGSSDILPLSAVGPNRFVQVDSDIGDGYHISATGDLELFDDEGHIRTASSLPEGATASDCLHN